MGAELIIQEYRGLCLSHIISKSYQMDLIRQVKIEVVEREQIAERISEQVSTHHMQRNNCLKFYDFSFVRSSKAQSRHTAMHK